MLFKKSESQFGWEEWLFLSSSMTWSAIEISLLVKVALVSLSVGTMLAQLSTEKEGCSRHQGNLIYLSISPEH